MIFRKTFPVSRPCVRQSASHHTNPLPTSPGRRHKHREVPAVKKTARGAWPAAPFKRFCRGLIVLMFFPTKASCLWLKTTDASHFKIARTRFSMGNQYNKRTQPGTVRPPPNRPAGTSLLAGKGDGGQKKGTCGRLSIPLPDNWKGVGFVRGFAGKSVTQLTPPNGSRLSQKALPPSLPNKRQRKKPKIPSPTTSEEYFQLSLEKQNVICFQRPGRRPADNLSAETKG